MVIKIAKKYIPTKKEKYMCSKHLEYFKQKLLTWRNDILQSSNQNFLKSGGDNISSPDIIDQAASQTEKSVEIRTVNRNRKLLAKVDSALKKIKDKTYGFCEETGEPIGLKRLIARPIATLCIEAQEKHEKNEKIFAQSN